MAIDNSTKLALGVVLGMFALVSVLFRTIYSLSETVHTKYDTLSALSTEAMHVAKTARPNPYTSQDHENYAAQQERMLAAALDELQTALLLRMKLNMAEVEKMFLSQDLPPAAFLKTLGEKEKTIDRRLFNLEVGMMSLEKSFSNSNHAQLPNEKQ